jgi:Putative transposon-encoded protein
MRKIELEKGNLTLTEDEVIGFLERVVTPIGCSAKADVPKRFMGHRAYVIITNVKVQK